MIRRTLAGVGVFLQRFSEDRGFLLASALSYSLLLCLAPLALLLVAGMGFLLQSSDIADYVLEMATSLVPGYSDELTAAVALLTRERKASGVLGGLGLAVFSVQLLSLTRTVMNATFRIERGRGWIHGFFFDMFALGVAGLLAAVLCGALLVAFSVGGFAVKLIPPDLLPRVRGGRLVALPLVYVTLTELLFFVYRTFPYTAVSTRAAAIGAVSVAALWELARHAFGAYLTTYGVYGRLYGSFGVLVAMLVWIYYSAVIFVLGAELTAMLNGHEPAAARGPARETAPHAVSRLVLIPAGVALAAVIVLAWQSNAPTPLHFLRWSFGDVPLAGVVLVSAALGVLLGGAIFWAERTRLRARLRGDDRVRSAGSPPPSQG